MAVWRKEILVRGGALGDFILTLPLLRGLAATGRSVLLVARPAFRCLLPAELAGGVRFLDGDSLEAAGLYGPPEKMSPRLRSWLAGARVHLFLRPDLRLAEGLARAGAAGVVWHDPRPAAPPHAAERFLRAAGLPALPGLHQAPLREPGRFGNEQGAEAGPGLWLHPGSGSAVKNWPVSVFAKFAAAWRRIHPSGVAYASFGPADSALLAPFCSAAAEAGVRVEIIIRPALDRLRDLMARHADFYVGNDSGVSHLAAALGIPCLVLFRATSPAVWRPLGRVVVWPPIPRGGENIHAGLRPEAPPGAPGRSGRSGGRRIQADSGF